MFNCLAEMLQKKLDTFVACFTIVFWEFVSVKRELPYSRTAI